MEERKLATVLFADLVGSTSLAHDEDPERVRALQERFFDAMAEEIERTGGVVEKFVGDAVMAVFGAPTALEDHVERALHAALAMQARVAGVAGPDLALRIGVNTGEVVVGEAREGGSFVTGDAVNVGSRLEQAAVQGEVLVGERAVGAAGGAFEFGALRTIEAKGKPGGVAARPLLRALTLARPRGAAGFSRVFVGRESELELLLATFRRAVAQGEPHLVTIVGEPGIGKTRLMRELWELLAGEEVPPVRRTGRCLPYGDGVTYWPVAEILREHFGILEGATPDEIERKLAGREVLGLALGLDAGRLHPLDARERLHEAVVEFVEELRAEGPAVFLVEDVHWAEDDLLDLIDRIVRDAHVPALVLTTARPELLDRRPSWGAGRRNAATIWLEPLAAAATSRMVDELLALELPAELRALVSERAEGNPFFVEELVGSLVEAGVLERGAEGWVAHDLPHGFSVPDSINAVLASRIDRLPATEKAALQAAAVMGRVFWAGPVVHLLDGEEPDFGLLEERDFVRRRGSSSMVGEREYAVKHSLTRDVAYAGIPKRRRGRLHAALADWLERSAAAGDEHASLLAYHYSRAVLPEDADLVWGDDPAELARLSRRAVHWLRRAGVLARGRYEILDAVALFERAVELSDDEHEQARLWMEIGASQVLRFDGEAFWTALGRALEGPLTPDERAEAYSMLAFQTSIRSGMWAVRPDPGRVAEWADAALELAGTESKARAQALLAHANVHARVTDIEQATQIAERLGDVSLRSFALAARGFWAFEEGRFGDADALVQRRLELVPAIDDLDHVTEVYESSVPTLTTLVRLDEARRLVDDHRRISAGLSPHHRVHAASLECEIEEAVGNWSAVVERTGYVVGAVERNLATPCVRNARCLLVCAFAHAAEGDDDRARELDRQASAIEGEGHDWLLAPPRLRLALLRGDREGVESLLESEWVSRTRVFGPAPGMARLDALAALRDRPRIEREAPPFTAGSTLLQPFALRALGIARADDDLLARADERFAALGLEWHRAQTERLLEGL
jgi:class 3 adenylate cyclase